MMVIRDVCPRCKSSKYKRNGHIHNGKQNHHCHDCGRQFVQCCEQSLISDDRRALIERLLVERISLRGICRAVWVTLNPTASFNLLLCSKSWQLIHLESLRMRSDRRGTSAPPP